MHVCDLALGMDSGVRSSGAVYRNLRISQKPDHTLQFALDGEPDPWFDFKDAAVDTRQFDKLPA